LGLSCRYKRLFILAWLLWSAQYKIYFFLAVHYFNLCVPIAQQTGQAEDCHLFVIVETVEGHFEHLICLSEAVPGPEKVRNVTAKVVVNKNLA
jgi:hypothetical protein